jgi:hypothetical protein
MSKTGLSLLIFSRGDTKQALDLISDMYDLVDEVVVIDSSSREEHKSLKEQKRRFQKMKVYYVIALGYADPMRMYALKKCTYQWVLLVDTDERLSVVLKSRLRELVGNPQTDAYAIRRYENTEGIKKNKFWTWQIRLFKKDVATYNGVIHEQPSISGIVNGLYDREAYLAHLYSMKGKSWDEYGIMQQFNRMDYKTYNEKINDYLYKFRFPKKPDKSKFSRVVVNIIRAYQKLKRSKPDDEVTLLDYLWFYIFIDIGYFIKQRDLFNLPNIISNRIRSIRELKWNMTQEDANEIFEISKRINSIGIIKYLGLDSEKKVKELNRKYIDKQQGVGLLIKLLKEQYYRESDSG